MLHVSFCAHRPQPTLRRSDAAGITFAQGRWAQRHSRIIGMRSIDMCDTIRFLMFVFRPLCGSGCVCGSSLTSCSASVLLTFVCMLPCCAIA